MNFHNCTAEMFAPDGMKPPGALRRITHLGIGAHQDDLEFMALHGIAECFESDRHWFCGVTCCDGSGSPRGGDFATHGEAEMKALRRLEQNRAAMIGRYGVMIQLDYPSTVIKNPDDPSLENDLLSILEATRPAVVYTHNPADKHPTHLAVLLAAIRAMRGMASGTRPSLAIGCELWRDLDWMPDGKKILMDVSGATDLSEKLNAVFQSQIGSGKRYDIATRGRRAANATFQDPNSVDGAREIVLGMDLTPLLENDRLDIVEYVSGLIGDFQGVVKDSLLRLSPRINP